MVGTAESVVSAAQGVVTIEERGVTLAACPVRVAGKMVTSKKIEIPSPRNTLGKEENGNRWSDYSGICNWLFADVPGGAEASATV